ncbi:MAG: PAS domain-containing protein [Gallionella sp.]
MRMIGMKGKQSRGKHFAYAPLRVKQAMLGESGVVPLEHPLVITYVSSCQQDNCMIYVSPQIARLGFNQEAWLGKTDLRLKHVHEGDYARLAEAIQRSRSTGERFNCHYRLHDSNGKTRWYHDEAEAVCNESGMPLFIRGAMLDITDKKEMEAELNQHRYCLERHVESRTGQLMKRISLLESCNAALGDKLALARMELSALKREPATEIVRHGWAAGSTPTAQSVERIDQLDGISDWARNMIGWRVAAAGAIA